MRMDVRWTETSSYASRTSPAASKDQVSHRTKTARQAPAYLSTGVHREWLWETNKTRHHGKQARRQDAADAGRQAKKTRLRVRQAPRWLQIAQQQGSSQCPQGDLKLDQRVDMKGLDGTLEASAKVQLQFSEGQRVYGDTAASGPDLTTSWASGTRPTLGTHDMYFAAISSVSGSVGSETLHRASVDCLDICATVPCWRPRGLEVREDVKTAPGKHRRFQMERTTRGTSLANAAAAAAAAGPFQRAAEEST
ncbi:hypothetical protein LZ30DRAFT_809256 [Colletotrichum cereale]|nr:hypothetical protein LZ30DRAFT_809256 [Colletotrichum cereale]